MQISNLKEYSTELNGKTFSVKYEMLFTMVDGKGAKLSHKHHPAQPA